MGRSPIEIAEWCRDVAESITHLERNAERLLGFALHKGENQVRGATASNVRDLPLPRELSDFYRTVESVDLPDFFVGYFIHNPKSVCSTRPDIPNRILTDRDLRVCTFGSDGGGGLFCITTDGQVYHLPPGHIEDSTYFGGLGRSRKVSDSFDDFLLQLQSKIKEFAERGTTSPF